MKIQVMPQELVKRIGQCQRAISSRTTMQILECIRFEAKEDVLTLTASDLELTIQTSMLCKVQEEGVMVVPSSMIGNIFRKLPSEEAILEEKDGLLKIRCADSYFDLQVPNPSEFPEVPEVDSERKTTVDNDALSRAVTETEFATSLDESKIALTGIFYERRPDSIRLVTLDGYRLAVRDVRLSAEEEVFEESMIVPKRCMIELSRLLSPEDRTIIRTVPGHIFFESGSLKLYSRLIDKTFINYEEIISEENQTKVVVDRQAFRDAIERASLLTQGERAHLIKLDFQDDGLHIASNSELGHVNEFIAMKLEGEACRIAFNARYLLDGVRALQSEKITLYLNGMLNPMVIRPTEEEDTYLYLVLPVRIAGE